MLIWKTAIQMMNFGEKQIWFQLDTVGLQVFPYMEHIAVVQYMSRKLCADKV